MGRDTSNLEASRHVAGGEKAAGASAEEISERARVTNDVSTEEGRIVAIPSGEEITSSAEKEAGALPGTSRD